MDIMEFLKQVLGDEELFSKLETALNAWNGNEANKDQQIKLANLASGDYVSKLKFEDLNTQLTGKSGELETANGLIAELKKGTKGDEEMQGKITKYESQVKTLQEELQETKIKSAVKVALLSEHAVDVDYLTYKLSEKMKEKSEQLELDENENIKGWEEKLSGLKTQFPKMFENKTSDNNKPQIFKPNKLPEVDKNLQVTKEQFMKMNYEQRLALKNENEQLFKQLSAR